MAKQPSLKAVSFDDLACKYGAIDFQDTLADFIAQTNHPTTSGAALSQLATDMLIPFCSVPVHHKIKFSNSDDSEIVDSIQIWPEHKDVHGHPVAACFDTALIRGKAQDSSLHGINGAYPHFPPPPKPNIRDDAAVATAAAIVTGVATTLQIAPVHPTDYLEKTPLPYEEYIKVLKAETIEAIQGPLMYCLGGKLESWEGEEFGVSLNNFHAACDIVLTALESGYYPTRSKTLLSATKWAELSSAAIAAVGRGYCRTENSLKEEEIKMARLQAIDSACGDIDNHPFANTFSRIIATTDQLSINLTVDENESGLVSWLTQTEAQVKFRVERLAAAEVEEALLDWKKEQIDRRSTAVEADIQRAVRERNTNLLHQAAKALGVDLQSVSNVSRPAPRAGGKHTVSGSALIPHGSTATPPPALPVTPENPTQPRLDERLLAALAATVQQALNPVLDRMSVIEKALPKPPTRANPPRATTTKVSEQTTSAPDQIRLAESATRPRAPEPDDDFIEVESGKSRKARVRKKKAQAAASASTANPLPGAATPPAGPLRQINLNPSSYAVATTNPAALPTTATSPTSPTPLLPEVTVLRGGCSFDEEKEKAIRARPSDSIVREVRAAIVREVRKAPLLKAGRWSSGPRSKGNFVYVFQGNVPFHFLQSFEEFLVSPFPGGGQLSPSIGWTKFVVHNVPIINDKDSVCGPDVLEKEVHSLVGLKKVFFAQSPCWLIPVERMMGYYSALTFAISDPDGNMTARLLTEHQALFGKEVWIQKWVNKPPLIQCSRCHALGHAASSKACNLPKGSSKCSFGQARVTARAPVLTVEAKATTAATPLAQPACSVIT
ncbi:hypothetical protein EI94DRAFT_1819257 [Lactarius quietus]|nr:hypothetical protein EI94DRAFT_1819257 [Lactarius quietus]